MTGPVPIYHPQARYPPSALADKINGQVEMDIIVGIDGRVETVRITRSLRKDVDESAAEVAKTWRFEPATRDGKPTAALITITKSFSIR